MRWHDAADVILHEPAHGQQGHLSTAVASRFSLTDSGVMGPAPGKDPLATGVFVSRSPYRSVVISIHFCPL